MIAQKKVKKINRTPVSLTFLESSDFFDFCGVTYVSSYTLFLDTGQAMPFKSLKTRS